LGVNINRLIFRRACNGTRVLPMWTWRSTLSKIKINIAGHLYFVCTCLYRLFRLYLKQLNKKWKIKNGQRAIIRFFNFIYAIRKRIVCTSLIFVCTSKGSKIQRVSIFAQPLYSELSQFSRYWNGNQRHSKENRLYPFVPLLFSFVSQRVRRYNAFQFLRNPYIANLVNFQDIEMVPVRYGL